MKHNAFRAQQINPGQAGIILGWNLEPVKKKMSSRGYSQNVLDQLELEYKRYLVLVTTYSMKLPISRPVDDMWHTHIMFTRDYANLGNSVGVFVHHSPVLNEEQRLALLPAYEQTLSLYEKNWGVPSEEFWPIGACVCDPEGEGTDD